MRITICLFLIFSLSLPVGSMNSADSLPRRLEIDSTLCDRLKFSSVELEEISNSHSRTATWLLSAEEILGIPAIRLLPEEFSWWMGRVGGVPMQAVPVSIHETSHRLEKLLRICTGKENLILGRLFADVQTLATTLLPDVRSVLYPAIQKKNISPTLLGRLNIYYGQTSNNHGGFGYIGLLHELNAYAASSAAELALIESNYNLPIEWRGYNGGIYGVFEFACYMVIYTDHLPSEAKTNLKTIPQYQIYLRHLSSQLRRLRLKLEAVDKVRLMGFQLSGLDELIKCAGPAMIEPVQR